MASDSARGTRVRTELDVLCRPVEVEAGDKGSGDFGVSNSRELRNFDYDDRGRLVETIQGQGTKYGDAIYNTSRYGDTAVGAAVRTYEYDKLDRPTQITFEDGRTLSYGYDEESNVTSVTENASYTGGTQENVTQYEYFEDNLLKKVTAKRDSTTVGIFDYSYDSVGRLVRIDYSSVPGLHALMTWDKAGRILTLTYKQDTLTLRGFVYEYDKSGNRTKTTESSGVNTTVHDYEYDWLDRLSKVKRSLNGGTTKTLSIYAYNDLDNITQLDLPEDLLTYEFTFDEASNIKTRQQTNPISLNFTENFTPDDDGNVLTRTKLVGGDTHQIVYEWDDFNKLVSVAASLNGSPAAEPKQENTYSVSGFRKQKVKKDGTAVTEYSEGLTTAVARSQAKTYSYIHGHQIMGFTDENNNAFFFLTDALGSVRDIVDSTGTVVQQYEFDERGNHVISPMSGGPASPKTFVGGLSVNDDTTDGGLYLMGARHYDPSLGRFLNRDPIGFAGGLNLFSYGGNNPTTYVDHTGLQETTGISFDQFMQEARQGVGEFTDYMVSWWANFGPGKIGQAAAVIEMSGEDSEGGGSLIPLIGGATGVLAKFLKNQKNQKKLNSLLKKHLVGSPAGMDCEKTARSLMRGLDELGVPAKYFNFKSKTPYLYHDSFGTFSNDGTHTAVVIGDYVFDKITGPSGQHVDAYKAMIRGTVRPDKQHTIVTSISSTMGSF
jgi:RHS repeat-associated protein